MSSPSSPRHPDQRVLYGTGSPIVVDYEETCERLGLGPAAIVNNLGAQSWALNEARVIQLSDYTGSLLALAVTVALFTPGHRKTASEQARARGAHRFDPLLDPTAVLPRSLQVAEGVYVNAGVVIGGGSRLGAFALVNRGACLGHHNELAEWVSIGPGVKAGGGVRFGRGCVVGTGAVILPMVSIGANAVVGAGAVVTRDVPERTLVVGNPALVRRTGIVGYNDVAV